MAEQKIVYVGVLEKIRLNKYGHKLVFPRGVEVELEQTLAIELLEHEGVFARPEKAEAAMAEIKKRWEEHQNNIQDENEVEPINFLVQIDGEEQDISKYTSAKLRTIAEAEDLGLDFNNVEVIEGETPVQSFRIQVAKALHEKYADKS